MTMELGTVAQELSVALQPALPFLVSASQRTADEAVARIGAEAWNRAVALWRLLRPKIDQSPNAREAVDKFVATEDTDWLAVLRLQLREMLESDPALASQVVQVQRDMMVRSEQDSTSGVYFQGSGNVVIHGPTVGRDQVNNPHGSKPR